MQATQTLPETYRKIGTLDVSHNRRLMLILNLLALVILVLSGWLFLRAMISLRPAAIAQSLVTIRIDSFLNWVILTGEVLILTALYVVLHEALHGIFFWVFTRTRPRFAFHWTYAYAAAPDWFIPRNRFLVTTLAPLVGITLLGLLIMTVAPAGWLLSIWYMVTMNAAGAVGDILVAIWLLRQPLTCLAQDCGDAVTLFVPQLP